MPQTEKNPRASTEQIFTLKDFNYVFLGIIKYIKEFSPKFSNDAIIILEDNLKKILIESEFSNTPMIIGNIIEELASSNFNLNTIPDYIEYDEKNFGNPIENLSKIHNELSEVIWKLIGCVIHEFGRGDYDASLRDSNLIDSEDQNFIYVNMLTLNEKIISVAGGCEDLTLKIGDLEIS